MIEILLLSCLAISVTVGQSPLTVGGALSAKWTGQKSLCDKMFCCQGEWTEFQYLCTYVHWLYSLWRRKKLHDKTFARHLISGSELNCWLVNIYIWCLDSPWRWKEMSLSFLSATTLLIFSPFFPFILINRKLSYWEHTDVRE